MTWPRRTICPDCGDVIVEADYCETGLPVRLDAAECTVKYYAGDNKIKMRLNDQGVARPFRGTRQKGEAVHRRHMCGAHPAFLSHPVELEDEGLAAIAHALEGLPA